MDARKQKDNMTRKDRKYQGYADEMEIRWICLQKSLNPGQDQKKRSVASSMERKNRCAPRRRKLQTRTDKAQDGLTTVDWLIIAAIAIFTILSA